MCVATGNFRSWLRPVVISLYFVLLCVALPLTVWELHRSRAETHVQAWFIAGCFVFLTIPISLWGILQHLVNYTKPELQRRIVRIIWMVPIYATDSWLALRFPKAAIYLDSLRECYEAYVIYNFMTFLLAYLNTEYDFEEKLSRKPQVEHFFPCCTLPPWKMGRTLINRCKQGALSYAVIRILTTVIAFCTELAGKYHEGDLSFESAWSYIVVINNCSQVVCRYFWKSFNFACSLTQTSKVHFFFVLFQWAMYCLVLFYKAARDELKPIKPFGKFLCIKLVVFASFWQGVLIAVLVKVLFLFPLPTFLAGKTVTLTFHVIQKSQVDTFQRVQSRERTNEWILSSSKPSDESYNLVELLMDAPSSPSNNLKSRTRETGNGLLSEERGCAESKLDFSEEGSGSERMDGHDSESTDASSDSFNFRNHHRSCDEIKTGTNRILSSPDGIKKRHTFDFSQLSKGPRSPRRRRDGKYRHSKRKEFDNFVVTSLKPGKYGSLRRSMERLARIQEDIEGTFLLNTEAALNACIPEIEAPSPIEEAVNLNTKITNETNMAGKGLCSTHDSSQRKSDPQENAASLSARESFKKRRRLKRFLSKELVPGKLSLDFIICVEMFIFAIIHYFTFSHKPYVDSNSPPPPCCSSFVSMWDVTDVRDDLVLQVQSVESTVRGAVDVVRHKRGQNATRGMSNNTEATPLLTRQISADSSSDEAPVIP
ncbi:Transmembrane protein 184C [Stylophora pistillata]|uniref:Transmembrane protein 184C n=1 Tax=Stylophora pistillata TaxID=50429 RepID=A0A2B4S7N3_STYPI|nr:Transmembrane protein 184C [Stylophora pistillata]